MKELTWKKSSEMASLIIFTPTLWSIVYVLSGSGHSTKERYIERERKRCVSCMYVCMCWWFYNVFVSIGSKDILMIACCSNYLAGGELKERREEEECYGLVQSNYARWWASEWTRVTSVLDYASRDTEREKRERERDREEKKMSKKKKQKESGQCRFASLKVTVKVIHTFLSLSFLVNSTSRKCHCIHLNELKVF